MCKREENIMDFAKKLCRDMAERVDDEHEVVIHEATVNNGIERVALMIRKKDARAFEMYPTVYLEDLFAMYCDGIPYEYICEKFENINADAQKMAGRNVSWVKDFEKVKDRICFKLINKESNSAVLYESPHRNFQDMAVSYYVFLEVDEEGLLTAPVNNYLLDVWGITEEELWKMAYANTCRMNPVRFASLEERLQELLGEFISASAARAYVLEGRYSFGAAHILYANELSRIAEEIDDNLYMFPMSIHEWFIVPVSEIESAQDMSEMASDYFETGLVDAEEMLSKAAYCYDREKGLYMIGE